MFDGNVPPREKVQREVDAREEHEHDCHEIDRAAIEISYAQVVRRETADRDGGEGMAQCIEAAHARHHVTNEAANRKTEIDVV